MVQKAKIIRCEHRLKGCIDCSKEQEYLDDVVEVYNQGELVVYPTETLYALGANPFHENALNRLIDIKKRPRKMPISIAVSNIEMMRNLAEVNALAEKIFKKFLPGPLTLLLKKKPHVPSLLTGDSDKIGIRVPKHPLALKIIDMVGPITSTSANLHSHAEPKNLDIAFEQLGEYVSLYLDCGECEHQHPSTVLDVSSSSAKIIRKGVISNEELSAVLAPP